MVVTITVAVCVSTVVVPEVALRVKAPSLRVVEGAATMVIDAVEVPVGRLTGSVVDEDSPGRIGGYANGNWGGCA